MNRNSDPKVRFTVDNITRCMCPGCPVQTNSLCANEKLEKLDEVIKSTGRSELPEPQDVPGTYCSTGIAACKDLDRSQMCICGSCGVWQEYNLVRAKPAYYFCTAGRSK